MPIRTPNTASEVTRAMALWASSFSFGVIIMSRAPTSGRKIASVRAQSSKVASIGGLSVS
jgi:hypothetical protein